MFLKLRYQIEIRDFLSQTVYITRLSKLYMEKGGRERIKLILRLVLHGKLVTQHVEDQLKVSKR